MGEAPRDNLERERHKAKQAEAKAVNLQDALKAALLSLEAVGDALASPSLQVEEMQTLVEKALVRGWETIDGY